MMLLSSGLWEVQLKSAIHEVKALGLEFVVFVAFDAFLTYNDLSHNGQSQGQEVLDNIAF